MSTAIPNNTHPEKDIAKSLSVFLNTPQTVFYKAWKGPGKAQDNAYYRHLFIYCLWKFTSLTVETIGKHVKAHPTCVNNSVTVINKMCADSPVIKAHVIEMEGLFE
jgi:hypothetical protein